MGFQTRLESCYADLLGAICKEVSKELSTSLQGTASKESKHLGSEALSRLFQASEPVEAGSFVLNLLCFGQGNIPSLASSQGAS